MHSSFLALLHLPSVCSTFNFHKAIIYCMLSFAVWLHSYAVMCSFCLFMWEDPCLFFCASVCQDEASVAQWTLQLSTSLIWVFSELNSCWRWWHLSVSVTTQLALVLHAARQIDSPQSCSALAESQTALIGTNKSSFMHYSKVDSGASFKFNRGRLPSGHICQVL